MMVVPVNGQVDEAQYVAQEDRQERPRGPAQEGARQSMDAGHPWEYGRGSGRRQGRL